VALVVEALVEEVLQEIGDEAEYRMKNYSRGKSEVSSGIISLKAVQEKRY
jgi:hypothetical protein